MNTNTSTNTFTATSDHWRDKALAKHLTMAVVLEEGPTDRKIPVHTDTGFDSWPNIALTDFVQRNNSVFDKAEYITFNQIVDPRMLGYEIVKRRDGMYYNVAVSEGDDSAVFYEPQYDPDNGALIYRYAVIVRHDHGRMAVSVWDTAVENGPVPIRRMD